MDYAEGDISMIPYRYNVDKLVGDKWKRVCDYLSFEARWCRDDRVVTCLSRLETMGHQVRITDGSGEEVYLSSFLEGETPCTEPLD